MNICKERSSPKKRMRYYKIYNQNIDKLNQLGNTFTAKEAKLVGLDQYTLTKLRQRGFLKRVEIKSDEFEWRKLW